VQLKTLYTLFCLAVLMFIAKPFIGFSLGMSESQLVKSNSLLAKSFAIRKPDDLNDAKSKANYLKQQLVNPPEHVSLTIAAILCLLFPLFFYRDIFMGYGFLNSHNANVYIPENIFLLTGKLTI
jgi:hypothetical protein